MPSTISISGLKPDEVKVEFVPETINLADVSPNEVKIEDPNPRRKLNTVEGGISGLAQTLTFGHSDEIIGAGRAAAGKLTGDDAKFSDLYKKYRDEQRAHIDAAKADAPAGFLGGQVLGVGASLINPGTAIGKGIGALTIPAKGASIGANVARAATAGALTGAGTSNIDPTQSYENLKGFGKDVAIGGAIGGATQGVLEKAGQGLSLLKPSILRKYAEEKAVKAAGAMKKDFNLLEKTGQISKVGRDLLDQKVVKVFSSLDDIAERSGELKKEAGKKIGEVLGGIDDLVQSAEKAGLPKDVLKEHFQFSMKNVGDRIRSEIVEANANNPLLKTEMNKLLSIADDFSQGGTVSLKDANIIKGTQGKVTKFASDTMPQAFQKEVYSIIKEEIDNAVGNVGIALEKSGVQGASGLKGIYESAKNQYGSFAQAEKMAKDRLGATRSNRTVSLTDTIAAAGGYAAQGPSGIALGAANKLIRKYGATAQAVGADTLAKILERSPDSLGKFGDTIAKAAKDGPLTLLTTQRALMKDPDYRNIIENFERENRGIKLPSEKRESGIRLPK